MPVALKVNNVTKVYGLQRSYRRSLMEEVRLKAGKIFHHPGTANATFRALDDVSFEMEQGETMCIIGRNGAGKSTLLRIISGITTPTSGSVEVSGSVASILEIGTGFHADLSGRENIYFSGSLLGMGKREIKANTDAIIDFSGISEFIDTPVKYYSDGMYMRLAFSVAAHMTADILLFDEVLATGDAVFRLKCFEKIKELTSNGKTVIIVTHNFFEVMDICSVCLLLENGKLKRTGEPAEVVSEYLDKSYSLFRSKQHGIGSENLLPAETGINNHRWSIPGTGNEVVKLHSVSVSTPFKNSGNEILTSDIIEVCIEFESLIPSIRVFPSYLLKDHTLHPVFLASPLLDKPSLSAENPGRYRAVSRIPAAMLNPGQFSVEIIFVDDFKNSLFSVNNVVSFNVHLPDSERSEVWKNNIPGAIQPPGGWQLINLD